MEKTSNEPPEEMIRSYLAAALWSSLDDKGNDLDARFSIGDFAPKALARAKKDVAFFVKRAGTLIEDQDPASVGHDLWLTRNRHGAGFWDRDYYSEDAAKKLTDIAHSMGEQNVVEGDDGKVYLEGGKAEGKSI